MSDSNTQDLNTFALDDKQASQSSQHRTETDIQNWLVSYLAELLEIPQKEISITLPFERYGLDSSAAILLIGEFEDWLDFEMDPTLLYDYPTIEALAQHMALEISQTTVE